MTVERVRAIEQRFHQMVTRLDKAFGDFNNEIYREESPMEIQDNVKKNMSVIINAINDMEEIIVNYERNMSSFQEANKSEGKWFNVFKVGGAVATSNAGFNPSLYQESVKPKKKKEKKYPLIEEEKDFWRD
tara:strand:- start:329 stop:721 length:393 start_codon:yes stop_codon:yes gene_type:complete